VVAILFSLGQVIETAGAVNKTIQAAELIEAIFFAVLRI
jgi:hypothetical protein